MPQANPAGSKHSNGSGHREDRFRSVSYDRLTWFVGFLGCQGHPLIQCSQNMADWKQITARIRRARSGKDPLGQLANLYEKTSDAMVAFELAKLFENSGQNSDAAKWYSTAAARFRRAEWKTKAQEAAVRLGGSSIQTPAEESAEPAVEFHLVPPEPAVEEKELPFEQN